MSTVKDIALFFGGYGVFCAVVDAVESVRDIRAWRRKRSGADQQDGNATS